MIREITLTDNKLGKELYSLQKASYQVEAELINFYNIPPLQETFEQFLNCGESFIGCFVDGIIVGTISYTTSNGEVTICRTIVHPDHFRKGIAGKLLHALEVKVVDCKKIYVSTGKDNIPAKNLYIKHEYNWVRDIEVTPSFYISLFDKQLN